MYYEDLSSGWWLNNPDRERERVAVGWLDSHHSFPKGATSRSFRWRLRVLAIDPRNPRARGGHACEFCFKAGGSAVFVFEGPARDYLCPELITHYVDEHDYLPPAEFVDAVESKSKEFFYETMRARHRAIMRQKNRYDPIR